MAKPHPWRRPLSWKQMDQLKKQDQNRRRYSGKESPAARLAKLKEAA